MRKYEKYLYTAKYADYIRSLTTTQVDDLVTVGEELKVGLSNKHCGTCILKFMKLLAEPYFEQKEKMENNRKKKEETENENRE